MSDYETLRLLANRPANSFPAVIEYRNGVYGFFCGAIPSELKDKDFNTAGDAVYALLRCEAVKQGKIQHFQIQEKDGHISRPYRRVSADKWVKDNGGLMCVTINS